MTRKTEKNQNDFRLSALASLAQLPNPGDDTESDEMRMRVRFIGDRDIPYGTAYAKNKDGDNEWRSYKLFLRFPPKEHNDNFLKSFGGPVMLNHSAQREDVIGRIEPSTLKVVNEKDEDGKPLTSLVGDIVLSKHSDIAVRIYKEAKENIGTYASVLALFTGPEVEEFDEENQTLTISGENGWEVHNIGLVYQGADPRARIVAAEKQASKNNNPNQENNMPDENKAKADEAASIAAAAELATARAEANQARIDACVERIKAAAAIGSITPEQVGSLSVKLAAKFGDSEISTFADTELNAAMEVTAAAKADEKPSAEAIKDSEKLRDGTSAQPDTYENAVIRCSGQKILALASDAGRAQLKANKVDTGLEDNIQEECTRRSPRAARGVHLPLVTFLRDYIFGLGDADKAERAYKLASGDTISSGGSTFPGIQYTDRIPALFQEALRDGSVLGDLKPRFIMLMNESNFPLQNETVSSTWGTGDTFVDSTAQRVGTEDRSLNFNTLEVRARISRKADMLVNAPAAYSITISDIFREFSEAICKAVLTGSGTNRPTGIFNTTGVNSVSTTATGSGAARVLTPSWQQITRYITATRGALRTFSGVSPMTACFVANSNVINSLMTTALDAGSGRFIAEDGETIKMYKLVTYEGLSNLQLLFGVFQQYVIGLFSDTIEVRMDTNIPGGGVELRCYQDLDGIVARPEGFATGNPA